MKRLLTLVAVCMLALGIPTIEVYANTLDDLTSTDTQTEQSSESNKTNNGSNTSQDKYNQQFIEDIQGATQLDPPSESVKGINAGISKAVSFLVQILAYLLTGGLTVRCIVDLLYIGVPFFRKWLSNGYQGMAQQGPQGGMQNGMGMGGMNGMGGMGMGGGMYGRGGMGMGGMGMGGMNGMGMNGMQNGMQGGMQGNQFNIQFVSDEALNAVETAKVQQINPFKIYAKSMLVTLVLAPILIVLSVSGVVAQLGFLIGNAIASGVAGIGGML